MATKINAIRKPRTKRIEQHSMGGHHRYCGNRCCRLYLHGWSIAKKIRCQTSPRPQFRPSNFTMVIRTTDDD